MIALRSGLLAHVMVHEIAYILKGIVRHSDTGIMKGQVAHWTLLHAFRSSSVKDASGIAV